MRFAIYDYLVVLDWPDRALAHKVIKGVEDRQGQIFYRIVRG